MQLLERIGLMADSLKISYYPRWTPWSQGLWLAREKRSACETMRFSAVKRRHKSNFDILDIHLVCQLDIALHFCPGGSNAVRLFIWSIRQVKQRTLSKSRISQNINVFRCNSIWNPTLNLCWLDTQQGLVFRHGKKTRKTTRIKFLPTFIWPKKN